MSASSNETRNQHRSQTLSDDDLEDDHEDSSDDSFDDSHANHETASREKYSFTINNGVITGVSELEHGVPKVETIEPNERYVLAACRTNAARMG